MNRLRISALVLALAASPAMAQGLQQWYLGAGIGQGSLGVSGQDLTGLANANLDDGDTTYTIRFGYQFHPNFAIELGYYDLGDYTFSGSAGAVAVTGSARAKSYGVSLVGIAPLSPYFEAYGRVGWAESEIKANANTALATASDSTRENGATYGAGVRWKVTPAWGFFAEWMKDDKIEVDSYLVGVDFRF